MTATYSQIRRTFFISDCYDSTQLPKPLKINPKKDLLSSLFYGARDEESRKVIIKRFLEERSFQREKRVQELLAEGPRHENIWYALAWSEVTKTITYPLAQGGNIKNLLRKSGICTPEQAIAVGRPLCKAIDYLHSKGIIHRDIKLENIFLQRTEYLSYEVKLSDFDVSGHESLKHLDKEGLIWGTPYYMAPEVVMGCTNDPRSDLYAIGIALFKILTGKFPFERDGNSIKVMQAHLNDEIPKIAQYNPIVTPAFQRVIEKTLAKNPKKRFQSGSELEYALAELRQLKDARK